MKKAKERLEAEAKLNMTPKQKLSNFWFYNRWIVIGIIVTAVLAAVFIKDIILQEKPDYQIGVVAPYMISEGSLGALEAAVKPYIDDRNGDGKVVISINSYTIATEEASIVDPNMQMAGMTRFSGDLQLCETMIYLLSDPTYYQKVSEAFQLSDGSMPAAETEYPPEMIGVPIADCKAFEALSKIPDLQNLYLAKRVEPAEKMMQQQDIANYYSLSMDLYSKLVNG